MQHQGSALSSSTPRLSFSIPAPASCPRGDGATLHIRYLLKHPEKLEEKGQKAQKFVPNTFLVTRLVRDNLTPMFASMYEGIERVELQPADPSQDKRLQTTIIAFWLRVRVR